MIQKNSSKDLKNMVPYPLLFLSIEDSNITNQESMILHLVIMEVSIMPSLPQDTEKTPMENIGTSKTLGELGMVIKDTLKSEEATKFLNTKVALTQLYLLPPPKSSKYDGLILILYY